jgi:hypothetical protein
MQELQGFGKMLVVVGILIVVVGLGLMFAEKLGIPFLGRLPGDIYIRKRNFQFYFPIVTSIVLSLILTLVFYLISYFSKR